MFRVMGRNLRLCFRRKLIIIRTQAIVLGEFIRERGEMTGELSRDTTRRENYNT